MFFKKISNIHWSHAAHKGLAWRYVEGRQWANPDTRGRRGYGAAQGTYTGSRARGVLGTKIGRARYRGRPGLGFQRGRRVDWDNLKSLSKAEVKLAAAVVAGWKRQKRAAGRARAATPLGTTK